MTNKTRTNREIQIDEQRVLACYVSDEALKAHRAQGMQVASILFAAIVERGDAHDAFDAVQEAGEAMPIDVWRRVIAADRVLTGLGYVGCAGMRADGEVISTMYVRRGSTAHANGIMGFREKA